MANKYANLDGSNKIKDEYKKINIGFDKVEEDIDLANSKVNTNLVEVNSKIDTNLFENKNYTDSKVSVVANDLVAHKEDYATLNTRVDTIITTPAEGITEQEIVDARQGELSLGANLTGVKAQLTESSLRLPHHKRFKIESASETHLESYTYTAFFSGANINGKEVHVARTGDGHASDASAFVAYIRGEDGLFTRKKIIGIDYSIGDFRDPNLSVTPFGSIILTAAVKLLDGSYTNYYYRLNDAMEVINTTVLAGMEGYFCWGNTLSNVERNTLKIGYSASGGGVVLFENVGLDGETIMQPIATIFHTAAKPTECTIGFWGRKLIAITRQNSGPMLYRETLDLSGKTGWGEVVDLGIIADAPCIQPYTESHEPLILTASYEEDRARVPFIVKFFDPKQIHRSKIYYIDSLAKRGGYNSLVKNKNGYGLMYYEDGIPGTTSVYYKEIPIETLGNEVHISNLLNSETLYDSKTFYEENTWTPNVEVGSNVASFGMVQGARYTRIGRQMNCQFEVTAVLPISKGVIILFFYLPKSRGKNIVTGSVHLASAARDSGSYVSHNTGPDPLKCVIALNVTEDLTVGKSLYVNVVYSI